MFDLNAIASIALLDAGRVVGALLLFLAGGLFLGWLAFAQDPAVGMRGGEGGSCVEEGL